MSTESRNPTDAELIRLSFEYLSSSLRVSLPCRVTAVDNSKNIVDCLPLVRLRIPNGDGEQESIEMPVIPDVPVAYPRFGNWIMHAPLSVGDVVLCLFSDVSLDAYRSQSAGAPPVDPRDDRQHHLSDAIALPLSAYADSANIPNLPAHMMLGHAEGSANAHFKQNEIALGSENPASFVALAAKVDAELTKLKTFFTTIGGPVPPVDGTAYAAVVYGAAVALQLSGFPVTVASTKVKAD